MKKIITAGALALASVGLATPVQAADSDIPGDLTADAFDFTSSAVCLAEVAVVPVLSDSANHQADHCSTGNIITP
jgi:hypothetical protein